MAGIEQHSVANAGHMHTGQVEQNRIDIGVDRRHRCETVQRDGIDEARVGLCRRRRIDVELREVAARARVRVQLHFTRAHAAGGETAHLRGREVRVVQRVVRERDAARRGDGHVAVRRVLHELVFVLNLGLGLVVMLSLSSVEVSALLLLLGGPRRTASQIEVVPHFLLVGIFFERRDVVSGRVTLVITVPKIRPNPSGG